jgi:ankyrin repeat protein
MQEVFNEKRNNASEALLREAACETPDPAVIERCIASGADVNRRNMMRATALMYAAYRGQRKIVDLLLEAGADPFLTDACGETARTIALGAGQDDVARALAAFEEGAMMKKARATVDLRSQKLRAVCSLPPGTDDVIGAQALLEGADIDQPDRDGKTPLIFATLNGHVKIMKLLIDAGANPFLKDQIGRTARAWAETASGSPSLAVLLLAAERNYRAEKITPRIVNQGRKP